MPRPAEPAAGAGAMNSPSAPAYDEQIGASFVDNFTNLAYNVTVLAQTDADGFGPGYILNGYTAQDYFYQVAVSYSWPVDSGKFPGFGFGYDVFGPNDAPVFPTSGGSGLDNFTGMVNSGDTVLLSLSFNGSAVLMTARDWNTGANAQTSFGSQGSTEFVGMESTRINFQGYFTGLMTEWYHEGPYSGSESGVTYASSAAALNSSWMWVDEFNTAAFGPVIFSNDTRVTIANDHQVYPYYADGALMSISAHEFTSGVPTNASKSKVTLVPSSPGYAPTFSVDYTLSGQPQTIVIPAGETLLAADPGTTMNIRANPAQSPVERWVFSGTTGTVVAVAAGADATYVVYHLVRELVSYRVADGGKDFPASSAPQLSYEIPPSFASANMGKVATTQALGTDGVIVFALLGTTAGINGTIAGSAGERWLTNAQDWNITAGGLVPYPVVFFQQYDVSVDYSVSGGAALPQPPEFVAASFGVLTSIPIPSGGVTGWFDAGSAYYFTGLVNGLTGTERWVSTGISGSAPATVSSPNEALSEDYTPQYFVHLDVNDAMGGSVFNDSGWFYPGTRLISNATVSQGWHFVGWSGSGAAAYNGTSPSIDVLVAGPLNEEATFYVELTIKADGGTTIAYSDASQSGTVKAGTTEVVDVPPSNVTLRAAPSLFVYSFDSWQGPGVANAKSPSLVLSVDSPSAVSGKSSYDFAGVLVLAAGAVALAVNGVAGSLVIRRRRRRVSMKGFTPG